MGVYRVTSSLRGNPENKQQSSGTPGAGLRGSARFQEIILILYFWLCWDFVASLCGFLWWQRVGAALSLPCTGFSSRQLLVLWSTGWRVLGLQ